MHMWAIEAEGISKSFPVHLRLRTLLTNPVKWLRRPRQVALSELSLKIAQGTCCAILGPNGAGKTTLTKMLALLLTPDQGQLKMLGLEAQTHRQTLRRQIAYVGSGERGFYDRLSARENLAFFATLYQINPTRIEPIVAQVGLWAALDQPVQMYSSGMRQRFAIARALLVEPQILLLDEPTRGIDPLGCEELYTLVQGLRQTGITVILCTQVLQEAQRLGEEFLFLNQGQVVASGNLVAIAQRLDLLDRLTLELSLPCVPGSLELPYEPVQPLDQPTRHLDLRVPQGHNALVAFETTLAHLRQRGQVVCYGAIQPPTLDSVYTRLMTPPPC